MASLYDFEAMNEMRSIRVMAADLQENVQKKSMKKDLWAEVFLVARVGVEPTRCHHRRILSPLRLPIPPSRHLLNLQF